MASEQNMMATEKVAGAAETKMGSHDITGSFETALNSVPRGKPGTRLWKLIRLVQAHEDDVVAAFPTEDEAVAWIIDLYNRAIAPKMPDVLDAGARLLIETLVRALYPG